MTVLHTRIGLYNAKDYNQNAIILRDSIVLVLLLDKGPMLCYSEIKRD